VLRGGPVDRFTGPSAPPSGQEGDPSLGISAGALGWLINKQIPEVEPPPQSQFFATQDAQAIVGAGTALTLPNIAVAVDNNSIAVVKSFDIFVTPVTATTQVAFALMFNAAPAPGFADVRVFPAPLSVENRGWDLSIPVSQNTTITVKVTDVDGAAYTVGCYLYGWIWPLAIDARYRPEGPGVR
jgi:hypothetical protein